MMIALRVSKMHVEEFFVDSMKQRMVIGVACGIVIIQRFHPVKHAHFTMSAGTHMSYNLDVNHYLEFADW